MTRIHPTAIIAPGAQLADDVVIGPYCVIGEHVVLGAGVSLRSHVVIDGRTQIGEGTQIYPFASVGFEPQDLRAPQYNLLRAFARLAIILTHLIRVSGASK